MVFPPNDKHHFTACYLGHKKRSGSADFRTKYSGKFKGA